MARILPSFLPPTEAMARAVSAEAIVVAGGIMAGAIGAAATRNAVTDLPDQYGPLWAPGTDSVSQMAAYLAVGTLPMAAPFAVVAALSPPKMVREHPVNTWGAANLLLIGVYPASLAVGYAGLEHRAPPHAAFVATLVGTVIVVGLQAGVIASAYAVALVLYFSERTRSLLPETLRAHLQRLQAEESAAMARRNDAMEMTPERRHEAPARRTGLDLESSV